jgi:hypothetical protein
VEAARRAIPALLPTARPVRLLREAAAAAGLAATPLREQERPAARGDPAAMR